MRLDVVSLVLDGCPWVYCHLPVFNTLNLDWRWHVIEGVSANVKDTAWCRSMPGRLSIDGTTDYLNSISEHKRVTVYRKPLWQGKTEMVNEPLRNLKGEGLILQCDIDELYSKIQLEALCSLMEFNPDCSRIQLRCKYYFGHDIVATSPGTYGNRGSEWTRLWRWKEGQLFESHEPPVMSGDNGKTLDLRQHDPMVFQHYAYATEEQVAFKERYYGYTGAVEQWRKLQANTKWPARLGDFCKWVKDETIVDKL